MPRPTPRAARDTASPSLCPLLRCGHGLVQGGKELEADRLAVAELPDHHRVLAEVESGCLAARAKRELDDHPVAHLMEAARVPADPVHHLVEGVEPAPDPVMT